MAEPQTAKEHLMELFAHLESVTEKRYPSLEALLEQTDDVEAQRDFYRLCTKLVPNHLKEE